MSEYTMVEQGTVALPSGYQARVTRQVFASGHEVIWVQGQGGAQYMLQAIGGSGLHATLNLMTGGVMRYRGNEVRFVVIGDIIEVKR